MVKFLVIRFSSIGDIVLTTPVIRCLKEQCDEAEIHYLTKKQFGGILQNNPFIDKIHLYDHNLKDLIRILKQEEFDYIIDLHHNLRSFLVKKSLRRVSFDFDKLNYKKWLLVNFKINKLPNRHIVDRYMDTIRLFIDKNDEKGLDFFIPEKDEVNTSHLFVDEPTTPKYIAFVIGAKHNTKQLPVSKIISICNKIDFPIILLGGAEDQENAEEILKSCKSNVYSAVGKFNLNQSASIIRQAEVVISHDTGLMHIASAFKKKIISIWGNTVPEFGMYPYLPDIQSKIIQVENLKCRPCGKIGFNKCPKGHFKCMNEIDEQKVVETVGLLIK